MQSKRFILTALLVILLPANGLAALEIQLGECPLAGAMAHGGEMALMASMPTISDAEMGDMQESQTHPCCQDAETVSRTGELCKPGQECGAGFSLPSIVATTGLGDLSNSGPLPGTSAVPIAPPDDLLRPPRT